MDCDLLTLINGKHTMKRRCIKRNKQKITRAIQDSKRNELCLSLWLSLRNQLSLNKQKKRSQKKNSSELDFKNAEFDSSLKWLMVTEVVPGISFKDYSVRIFQSSSELPTEFQKEFSHFWK